MNYIIHNSERFYGKWTTLPDGHAFDYTALGLSTYKGRITVRHAREDGVWGEYWEINEPGVAECRPWFMTAAGNCLYAINSMLLMEADIGMPVAQVAKVTGLEPEEVEALWGSAPPPVLAEAVEIC